MCRVACLRGPLHDAAPTNRLRGVLAEALGTTRADIAGRPIIAAMAPDGPGRWSGGANWAPDDDKTCRSKVALTGGGLRVEGCVLVVCRGQTWTRLD